MTVDPILFNDSTDRILEEENNLSELKLRSIAVEIARMLRKGNMTSCDDLRFIESRVKYLLRRA